MAAVSDKIFIFVPDIFIIDLLSPAPELALKLPLPHLFLLLVVPFPKLPYIIYRRLNILRLISPLLFKVCLAKRWMKENCSCVDWRVISVFVVLIKEVPASHNALQNCVVLLSRIELLSLLKMINQKV